jgi:hypothetical protein
MIFVIKILKINQVISDQYVQVQFIDWFKFVTQEILLVCEQEGRKYLKGSEYKSLQKKGY